MRLPKPQALDSVFRDVRTALSLDASQLIIECSVPDHDAVKTGDQH